MSRRDATLDMEHRDLARGLNGGLEFSAIVEAGAGTGKTSVLVDRLLALVRAGTSVSRIVAITFTEKAAGELRVRFRTKIEEALASDGPDARPDDEGGRSPRETAHRGTATRETRPRETALLETALREIDRANVGTIHGFCARLLKERPVEAGIDPDFGVADELRRTVLLESSWDAWIRAELKEGLPAAAAEAHFAGLRLSKIQELAFKLVNDRDALELLPEPVDTGDVAAFIRELSSGAREIRAGIDRCTDLTDKAVPEIEAFAAQVESLEFLPDDLKEAFALRRVSPRPTKSKGKKTNWEGEALDELRGRARALTETQESLRSRAAHNTAVSLLKWLQGFMREYERQKAQAGLLDFQDLLSKTRDLLKHDRPSRQYFKRSFDRILVDEFQDTDPLQCEIAFFLAETESSFASDWKDVELEPGKLFIVGDPKQSIYRFRRADIEMYELAKKLIGRSGRILALSENFRTRPSIVESVNEAFEGTMVAPEGEHAYQPDYEALVAHRPADDAGPGVVLLRPSEPLGGANAPEVRRAEATAVAAYIRSVLDSGRPLVYDRGASEWRRPELGDIAVLFHRLTGLPFYEEAFNTYGLDYRIAGGKRFYARREVSELATVLAAVDDPNDLMSVVGALRSPFMGVSDDDIVVHRHRTGGLRYLETASDGVPAVESAFRILRDLHRERSSLSVAALVNRLFDRTGVLELYLLKPTGEQRHANLLKIVELATALERQSPMSFSGFVRWLRDVQQLTPEEGESPLAEEGDQFLRVLTIHKSKGLEFPITILADLGRHKAISGDVVIDRDSGVVEYGKGKGAEQLATLGFEDARELEKNRAAAELLRLLYVGMTRARDAVIIPWYTGGKGLSTVLLDHLAGVSEIASNEGDARAQWVTDDSLDLDVREARPVRLPVADAFGIEPAGTKAAKEMTTWSESLARFAPEHDRPPPLLTPSSLAHGSAARPSAAHARPSTAPARPPGAPSRPPSAPSRPPGAPARPSAALVTDGELEDAGRFGSELGSLVHAMMERVALDGGNVEAVASAASSAAGAANEMASEARTMTVRALASDVVRRAASSEARYREVPFALVRGETMLEGKIDLLFQEEDGLVVVDYKTDREPPGGYDALVERYRAQALAYGVAAEATTGLPLKEVVLLFLRPDDPLERTVEFGSTREERGRELDRVLEAEAQERA